MPLLDELAEPQTELADGFLLEEDLGVDEVNDREAADGPKPEARPRARIPGKAREPRRSLGSESAPRRQRRPIP